MKKTALISASLMMLLFWTMVSSGMNQGKPVENSITTSMIRYEVIIHLSKDLGLITCPLVISMTDPSGNLIDPPQPFYPSRDVYTFTEKGPVTGGRVAHLSLAPGIESGTCFPVSLVDSKRGTFVNGEIYKFNLYPPALSANPTDL